MLNIKGDGFTTALLTGVKFLPLVRASLEIWNISKVHRKCATTASGGKGDNDAIAEEAGPVRINLPRHWRRRTRRLENACSDAKFILVDINNVLTLVNPALFEIICIKNFLYLISQDLQ